MEDYIPAIARWLGSNALVFFAVATAVALTLLAGLWYLLVHHTRTLARFAGALPPAGEAEAYPPM